VHLSSKLMSQPKLRRCLLVLGAIYVLIGPAARAQNLDQGKSAKLLFADSCATCHRSARGLARGRFRLTLFLFLREHYASNSSAAWELTSYLESVDRPQSGRSRAAAVKPSRPATWTPRSPIRPPMPVPLPSARSN
jgi:mono/diheme cytochrome c family protein